MFDYDKFAYYSINKKLAGRGPRGFTGYTDRFGDVKMIWDGRTDRQGDPIPRVFRFSRKEQTMRIPLSQKDKHGTSVATFLDEHPQAKNSPNAAYASDNWLFSRIDEEGDATTAIDAKTLRIKAENFCLGLEKEDAIDTATLFGTFTDKYKLALHCLLENAGNEPEDFMAIVDDSTVKIKIVLRKALKKGLFKRKGGIIKWEKEIIGADEESAIQRLMKDDDLLESIEINLKK